MNEHEELYLSLKTIKSITLDLALDIIYFWPNTLKMHNSGLRLLQVQYEPDEQVR